MVFESKFNDGNGKFLIGVSAGQNLINLPELWRGWDWVFYPAQSPGVGIDLVTILSQWEGFTESQLTNQKWWSPGHARHLIRVERTGLDEILHQLALLPGAKLATLGLGVHPLGLKTGTNENDLLTEDCCRSLTRTSGNRTDGTIIRYFGIAIVW